MLYQTRAVPSKHSVVSTSSLLLFPTFLIPIAYVHSKHGRVVQGKMTSHKCTAKIVIWFPVDPSIRKCIVLPQGVHSHPMQPSRKLTPAGRERYTNLVRQHGILAATASKVERFEAQMNSGLLISQQEFPALTNIRRRRDILKSLKTQQFPAGPWFPGVEHACAEQKALPLSDRYVHHTSSIDQLRIVVTMRQGLAEVLTTASSIQVDFTYKRVQGEFKEWEVTMWYTRLNIRKHWHSSDLKHSRILTGNIGITVARLYCNYETQEAFRELWRLLFSTAEEISGNRLGFHRFGDGKLKTIVVDGDAAQASALGEFLMSRYSRTVDGIEITSVIIALSIVLKTCSVHYQRYVLPVNSRFIC